MNQMMNAYNTCLRLPAGKWIFSKLISFIAPYNNSIKAQFVELRPGYCEIKMKKRRSVLNHIKTIHAIAMCNMCEMAGGTLMEATLPPGIRWLPKGMTVDYIKLATTDLKGICEFGRTKWDIDKPETFPVVVHILDAHNVEVMRGTITMSLKPKK